MLVGRRIVSSLIFVLPCVCAFSVLSQSNAPTLLKRLDSAKGSPRAIEVLRLLVKLKHPDSVGLGAYAASDVVDTIEQIIVLSTPGNISARFLNQVRIKSNDVLQLSSILNSELNSLSWHSRLLFGSPVSKIVANYLDYELRSVHFLKAQLVRGRQADLQREIRLCLSRCTAALIASRSTVSLMQAADISQLQATVQQTFGKAESHVSQDVGRSLAVSITMQKNTTLAEDQIKYLRENLAVIIKSGIFMVFCFTFKFYICTFVFGVLLTMSTAIWIAIFLQLMDVSSNQH
ncbi:hypothetical protein HG536_0C02450 [Torulaspora globosa]|uniref:Uncharacterized protein n=1 Tax=Torulaspora globosa TaxID=48254 RepID=A0A7G3ZEZ0_9SACH|nr:uncharacterized protein HG536_0C02450 [Torulaspora globosa]QLL32076.1 hypothetical protein HG536_0C02450 [Torulaspora globosa]